jgi:DNA-binding transcriptional MerR regulator
VAKGPDAFRTISEASDEVGVPQHVLRFWETRFPFIKPMKRAGGRRFYRPADLTVLKGVRRLLHDEGYTIKGVQRLYKEDGPQRFAAAAAGEKLPPRPAYGDEADADPAPATALAASPPSAAQAADLSGLKRALDDLQAAKARLDAVLARS